MGLRYMMATKAFHDFAHDISREEPDLCEIHSENESCYIGNWVEGFGLIRVNFPKETTRELTDEEIKKYNGQTIGIPGSWAYRLEIKKQDSAPKDIEFHVPIRRTPAGAQLAECYQTKTEYIIVGEVDNEDESHNCDQMGCGSFSHVVARFKKNSQNQIGLNDKELKLLQYFMNKYLDVLSNNNCNDIPDEAWEGWTEDEKRSLSKDFHDINGDPESFVEAPDLELGDYSVVWFLMKKLER